MKTLSKSPYGIYLLEKDEVTSTLGKVPLSELTEEQAQELIPYKKDELAWFEDSTWFNYFKGYINELLRQNNEPKLRQGVCENCWGKAHLLTCDVGEPTQTEAYKELIKVCTHYTKLSDILIEIP